MRRLPDQVPSQCHWYRRCRRRGWLAAAWIGNDVRGPGRAPPYPRPRIAVSRSSAVAECPEDWFGNDVPQPAQDIKDGMARFFLLRNGPIWYDA